MKKNIAGCLFSLLVASVLHAQTPTATLPPAFFVDSQRIDLGKIYLNPDNISNINVQKEANTGGPTNGSVYITMKTPFSSFLTLSAIGRQQKGLTARKVLYIINDSIIHDTSGVRIDPSYQLSVHNTNIANIPYLGDSQSDIAVLVIETKSAVSSEKGPQIRLRGAPTTKAE